MIGEGQSPSVWRSWKDRPEVTYIWDAPLALKFDHTCVNLSELSLRKVANNERRSKDSTSLRGRGIWSAIA
jgi:hypothetical protein